MSYIDIINVDIINVPDPVSSILIFVGLVFIYLGSRKGLEPLMLVPIGFGILLANIPLSGLNDPPYGLLYLIREKLLITEVLPCLAFLTIGTMMDLRPLLKRPWLLLFGISGQSGVILALLLSLFVGFNFREAIAVGIIGCADGPTAIFVSTKYAPHLLGAIGLAAYTYISIVPLLQVPLMRALISKKEMSIKMPPMSSDDVSETIVIAFPIVLILLSLIFMPSALPLIGMLALGNFLRESGVTELVDRYVKTASTSLADIVTLLLGLSVGSALSSNVITATPDLPIKVITVFALGIVAFAGDLIIGILTGKLVSLFSKGKINPAIGASANSAFPVSARVVQREVSKASPGNIILMYSLTTNLAGQVTSPVFAGIILTLLNVMGI
ncbi:MAG: sodium ion-translocating decarboxylase subunit beta [Sulfolobales archaeon]